jgi:hypothetical protein
MKTAKLSATSQIEADGPYPLEQESRAAPKASCATAFDSARGHVPVKGDAVFGER